MIDEPLAKSEREMPPLLQEPAIDESLAKSEQVRRSHEVL